MEVKMLQTHSFRPDMWIRNRRLAQKGEIIKVSQVIGERLIELGYAEEHTSKPTPTKNKATKPSENKAYLGNKKKGGWYDVYDATGTVVATLREKDANAKLEELNANV